MKRFNTGKTSYIVIAGFLVIFGAFLSVFQFSYSQLTTQHQQLILETKNNDIQQSAAMDMRVAVRERAILLWQMTLAEDLFERDMLAQRFYEHGGDYLHARDRLLASHLMATEAQLIEHLEAETGRRAPELRTYAEHFLFSPKSSIDSLNRVLTDQIVVANLLDELIDMQQKQNEAVRLRSAQETGQLFQELLLMVVTLVLLGFAFAWFVMRTVIRQRRLLSKANRKLHHLATHDPLTGLANRALLIQQIEQRLASLNRRPGLGAVLFIDLDDFKPINDCLGHSVGDYCLQQVAQRLRHNLRKEDLAGRLGGDEFLVVLNHLDTAHQAETVAAKLAELISEPIIINDKTLLLTASIGLAYLKADTPGAEAVIQMADQAMYTSKAEGKNSLTSISSRATS